MKRSSWGICVALVMSLFSPAAMSAVSFYAEGAVGFTSTADFEDMVNEEFDASLIGDYYQGLGLSLEADDYNVGGNMFVGLAFNRFISMELAYFKYRDFSADFHKSVVELDGDGIPVGVADLGLKGKMAASTFGIGARLDVPISSNVGLFGRLGVHEWRQEVSYSGSAISYWTSQVPQSIDTITTSTDTGFNFYGGVGAKFKLAERTSIYVELNAVNMGEDEFEIMVLGTYLGLRYDFAGSTQSENARRAQQNDKRAVTACDPKYKDISGIACE